MKLKLYQVFVCLFLGASAVFTRTTKFSYQGKPDDGAVPANTRDEMKFRFQDNSSNGRKQENHSA